MSPDTPVLHMMCGKIAAGKSTLSATLSQADRTVRIAEDDWLAALFSGQLASGQDYLRCSERLQKIMAPHVSELLKAGVSVVLDFPANTPQQRAWMRDVIATSGARHQMHVLDAPDAICLARLSARNASGQHAFTVTDKMFHAFTRNFAPPGAEEGFNIVLHKVSG
ncbi:AAA family ATPase [Alphaproteobacteria bacterium GH1-50]|uniref:AAA family ATPase n=1 Tax=Kangsaoukella pontilimi TaxID=2691042 RepID=A0A7C9MGN2_9RHOB|nr:ATP-binding protein [Kangsaoukella pontilimi]MXQ09652.1 AAA family ATPase [Kangsaoukella pontilimi]